MKQEIHLRIAYTFCGMGLRLDLQVWVRTDFLVFLCQRTPGDYFLKEICITIIVLVHGSKKATVEK